MNILVFDPQKVFELVEKLPSLYSAAAEVISSSQATLALPSFLSQTFLDILVFDPQKDFELVEKPLLIIPNQYSASRQARSPVVELIRREAVVNHFRINTVLLDRLEVLLLN